MGIQHRIILVLLIWLGNFPVCTAAMPTAGVVGNLLGFPSTELVIEDVTIEERTILQTPTGKEKRRNTIPPDPAVLLKAYHIRGKTGNTFIPIQVYIGKREAFLTPEVLVKVDQYMAGLRSKDAFWMVDFESLGRGGMYFTLDHKVRAQDSGLKEPRLVPAEFILMQPHGQNFDVKIVMRPTLPGDGKLVPIPGGEVYFSIYGTLEDETREPKLDLAEAALELAKTVISEWLAEQNAHSYLAAPLEPGHAQVTLPTTPPAASTQSVTPPGPTATQSGWWLAGLAMVAIAFLAYALRKCCR